MKKRSGLLKTIIILLCVIVFVIAGIALYFQSYKEKSEEQKVVTIGCVGDSLTFQRSYEDSTICNYTLFLSELLGDGFEVTNYGYPGTCVQSDLSSPYINTRVYQGSLYAQADIIVIMLGTNDIWNEGWRDKETFYQHYKSLLESYFKAENIPKIYLCTIPKFYVEENAFWGYDLESKAEMVVDVIRQLASEYACSLIEIDKITSEHSEWYREDGLHFNEAGAKGVADAIGEMIQKDLGLLQGE